MNEFLFYLKWWSCLGILGLFLVARKHIKAEGYITVGDLFFGLLIFLTGPIIVVGIVITTLYDFVEYARKYFTNIKDVVLWRSKSNRTSFVLFGDKNTNDNE